MGSNISHLVDRSQFWEGELVISKKKKGLHWPAQVVKVDEDHRLKDRRYNVRLFGTGKVEFVDKKHLYPYKENRGLREEYKDIFDYVNAWEIIEEKFVSENP